MTISATGTNLAKLASDLSSAAFVPVFAEIEKQIEAKIDAAVGSLTVKLALEDAGFDFDELPRVGTKYPANNPETVQMWDAAKQKYVDANAFTIWANNTPLGKRYEATIEDIKLAQKPETAKQSKGYADQAHDGAYLKDELELFNGKMTSLRTLWRNVARIDQQTTAINELPGVELTFNTYNVVEGGKRIEKMKRTKKPFRLWSLDGDDKRTTLKDLSVGEFLKLIPRDAQAAVDDKKAADMFTALQATLSRDTDPKSKFALPKNVNEFHHAVNMLLSYTDAKSEDGAKHRAAIASEAAKTEDLRQALFQLATMADGIYSTVKIETPAKKVA